MTSDKNWMNKEMTRIEKEESERPEYVKFEEGATDVIVDLNVEPRDYDGRYGMRKIVTLVMPDGVSKLWGLSPVTFDKMISTLFESGQTEGKANLQVIRVGVGKDTRWSFKA